MTGTLVTTVQAIETAIERGQRDGLPALDGIGRWVFLLSEAEVLCDKDGVDSFIDRYGAAGLLELSEAYRHIGAQSLALASRAVAETLPNATEEVLHRLNTLVCDRVGYDYKAIQTEVTRQLALSDRVRR